MSSPERIAQARALVAEGWTQSAIADKFGVNQSAISRWCNPKRGRTGLCACGCGTVVGTERRSWNLREFAPYHDRRGEGKDYEVRDCGFHTPCWVWLKCRNGDGYGHLQRDGVPTSAHRYYWEQANGPVPEGLELDHKCVNPPCCNPAHLEPVTHSTNSRRRQDAKLSWGSARAIRVSELSAKELAQRYGISASHVNSIRAGRRWQEAA